MDKKTYDLKYARERLKRVPLDLTHDDYTLVKKAADAAGESVNGYIKKCIAERMLEDYDRQPYSELAGMIDSHTPNLNKTTIIDTVLNWIEIRNRHSSLFD